MYKSSDAETRKRRFYFPMCSVVDCKQAAITELLIEGSIVRLCFQCKLIIDSFRKRLEAEASDE
jgi:hypothetical protein